MNEQTTVTPETAAGHPAETPVVVNPAIETAKTWLDPAPSIQQVADSPPSMEAIMGDYELIDGVSPRAAARIALERPDVKLAGLVAGQYPATRDLLQREEGGSHALVQAFDERYRNIGVALGDPREEEDHFFHDHVQRAVSFNEKWEQEPHIVMPAALDAEPPRHLSGAPGSVPLGSAFAPDLQQFNTTLEEQGLSPVLKEGWDVVLQGAQTFDRRLGENVAPAYQAIFQDPLKSLIEAGQAVNQVALSGAFRLAQSVVSLLPGDKITVGQEGLVDALAVIDPYWEGATGVPATQTFESLARWSQATLDEAQGNRLWTPTPVTLDQMFGIYDSEEGTLSPLPLRDLGMMGGEMLSYYLAFRFTGGMVPLAGALLNKPLKLVPMNVLRYLHPEAAVTALSRIKNAQAAQWLGKTKAAQWVAATQLGGYFNATPAYVGEMTDLYQFLLVDMLGMDEAMFERNFASMIAYAEGKPGSGNGRMWSATSEQALLGLVPLGYAGYLGGKALGYAGYKHGKALGKQLTAEMLPLLHRYAQMSQAARVQLMQVGREVLRANMGLLNRLGWPVPTRELTKQALGQMRKDLGQPAADYYKEAGLHLQQVNAPVTDILKALLQPLKRFLPKRVKEQSLDAATKPVVAEEGLEAGLRRKKGEREAQKAERKAQKGEARDRLDRMLSIQVVHDPDAVKLHSKILEALKTFDWTYDPSQLGTELEWVAEPQKLLAWLKKKKVTDKEINHTGMRAFLEGRIQGGAGPGSVAVHEARVIEAIFVKAFSGKAKVESEWLSRMAKAVHRRRHSPGRGSELPIEHATALRQTFMKEKVATLARMKPKGKGATGTRLDELRNQVEPALLKQGKSRTEIGLVSARRVQEVALENHLQVKYHGPFSTLDADMGRLPEGVKMDVVDEVAVDLSEASVAAHGAFIDRYKNTITADDIGEVLQRAHPGMILHRAEGAPRYTKDIAEMKAEFTVADADTLRPLFDRHGVGMPSEAGTRIEDLPPAFLEDLQNEFPAMYEKFRPYLRHLEEIQQLEARGIFTNQPGLALTEVSPEGVRLTGGPGGETFVIPEIEAGRIEAWLRENPRWEPAFRKVLEERLRANPLRVLHSSSHPEFEIRGNREMGYQIYEHGVLLDFGEGAPASFRSDDLAHRQLASHAENEGKVQTRHFQDTQRHGAGYGYQRYLYTSQVQGDPPWYGELSIYQQRLLEAPGRVRDELEEGLRQGYRARQEATRRIVREAREELAAHHGVDVAEVPLAEARKFAHGRWSEWSNEIDHRFSRHEELLSVELDSFEKDHLAALNRMSDRSGPISTDLVPQPPGQGFRLSEGHRWQKDHDTPSPTNVILHMRMSTRPAYSMQPNGEFAANPAMKVLYLDERQSDWHQAILKEASRGRGTGEVSPAGAFTDESASVGEVMWKAILQYAVKHDYTHVSWTPGWVQRQRTAKHMSSYFPHRIYARKFLDEDGKTKYDLIGGQLDTFDPQIAGPKARVEVGETYLGSAEAGGQESLYRVDVPESELHKILGQENANQIINHPDNFEHVTLQELVGTATEEGIIRNPRMIPGGRNYVDKTWEGSRLLEPPSEGDWLVFPGQELPAGGIKGLNEMGVFLPSGGPHNPNLPYTYAREGYTGQGVETQYSVLLPHHLKRTLRKLVGGAEEYAPAELLLNVGSESGKIPLGHQAWTEELGLGYLSATDAAKPVVLQKSSGMEITEEMREAIKKGFYITGAGVAVGTEAGEMETGGMGGIP